MENASKALIIAGAILLAILIISLGIIIYQQAAGVTDDSNMEHLSNQNFNLQWTNYEGNRVAGSTVNAMLQSVLANNTSQGDSTSRRVQVTIDGTEAVGTNGTAITKRATNGDMYTVTCKYGSSGASQGLVTLIEVTKNS